MSRDHRCECRLFPRCDNHRAYEWGGGEPDKCEVHGHDGIDTIEEVRAKSAILRAVRPFPVAAQRRIIQGVIDGLATPQPGKDR